MVRKNSNRTQFNSVYSFGIVMMEMLGVLQTPGPSARTRPALPKDIKKLYPVISKKVKECTKKTAEERPTMAELVSFFESQSEGM